MWRAYSFKSSVIIRTRQASGVFRDFKWLFHWNSFSQKASFVFAMSTVKGKGLLVQTLTWQMTWAKIWTPAPVLEQLAALIGWKKTHSDDALYASPSAGKQMLRNDTNKQPSLAPRNNYFSSLYSSGSAAHSARNLKASKLKAAFLLLCVSNHKQERHAAELPSQRYQTWLTVPTFACKSTQPRSTRKDSSSCSLDHSSQKEANKTWVDRSKSCD